MGNDISFKTWVGCDLKDADAAKTKQGNDVANALAGFITAAHSSVHIAIYDFRLDPAQAGIVLAAFDDCVKRGVDVRVAYFEQPPAKRTASKDFSAAGGDPFPGPDPKFLKKLQKSKVQTRGVTETGIANLEQAVSRRAIAGGGHLMHSKYVVRDGSHPDAAVWMGSANFTSDAWSIQDNNIVMVTSQSLANYYETDFAELWSSQRIAGTGKNDHGTIEVGGDEADVIFSPGDGAMIETDIAGLISSAKKSIEIASMVISSGAIMGALIDALGRGVKISGVYDGPEMENVKGDWQRAAKKTNSQKSIGKEEQWAHIAPLLVAKASAPYTTNGPHNFMHNKAVVIDSAIVSTGSFNYSENAAHNAENVLTIHDAAIAKAYGAYVQGLVAKFKAAK